MKGSAGMAESRRETVVWESIPVLAPLGLAFKRMMAIVERESGLTAARIRVDPYVNL